MYIAIYIVVWKHIFRNIYNMLSSYMLFDNRDYKRIWTKSKRVE